MKQIHVFCRVELDCTVSHCVRDCIVTILTHGTPTIRAVNPTTWIKETPYLEQAFQPSLHTFTAQRTALLALQEPLLPDGWARAATLTGAGKPLVRTAQGMPSGWPAMNGHT
jgi:hypothetical protein